MPIPSAEAARTGASRPPVALTYLDHAATTPLRSEAFAAMEPWLTSQFGNPTGAHAVGRQARRAIDDARDVIAAALGARPSEVVFTSGGTEADNLAVAGLLVSQPGPVWCSAVEHHAVLTPVEARGGRLLAVDPMGRTDVDAFVAALEGSAGPLPSLVSVMAVNNEVGVIQPLASIVEAVRAAAPNARLHTDAVQALPWLDVAALASGFDAISVTAHKLGGPQGVGALVVRDGVALGAQLLGGGQEHERRSGTHNVAGIVGFAAAVESLLAERDAVVERVGRLRDRLLDGLLARIDRTLETAAGEGRAHKVAGSCHLCIEGIEAEALLFLLDREGLCASAASSCASGALDPSHVLAAIGVPRSLAAGSLRLSLGASTTDAEVDRALDLVPAAVAQLRGER